MTYSGSRTSSAGTERRYLPRPQSWSTTYDTDAIHSPSGHLTQASCRAGTHAPSCQTSTGRGGSMRRTSSDTGTTVGAEAAVER